MSIPATTNGEIVRQILRKLNETMWPWLKESKSRVFLRRIFVTPHNFPPDPVTCSDPTTISASPTQLSHLAGDQFLLVSGGRNKRRRFPQGLPDLLTPSDLTLAYTTGWR
ncbi:hypothetical protein RRG08_020105 [Elysia crispata]|uniref:Uncharacterized protein n=1 Tax=Elysia crispata TaxID=231223 RepID=A0AAE1A4F7_9GAST|nr:hypothetical protein RRG08_020105 [Elysia crispata]